MAELTGRLDAVRPGHLVGYAARTGAYRPYLENCIVDASIFNIVSLTSY